MIDVQSHRGPDAFGLHISPSGMAGLGHNRLGIIDLSDAGCQPMSTPEGRYWLVFNGEIYNYRELRQELAGYPFQSRTDSEVILAAWERWGAACLDRFLGMFAFAIWDEHEQQLFAARDRFGVKPLYYSERPDGGLIIASEIKALHAAGVSRQPDAETWATYLSNGAYDHSDRTFWKGIRSLSAGHQLTWGDGLRVTRWYDLAARTGTKYDDRSEDMVLDEYHALLKESIDLRFRSDVPVGFNLSGGLDSSVLLAAVQEAQPDRQLLAFTFATGDDRYDETPWVEQMLAGTGHESVICQLGPEDVPSLAESVQQHQDEPFGGLPTLAYAHLFEEARRRDVVVLLDGQGMDEQWAGYDYYRAAGAGIGSPNGGPQRLIQGTRDPATRPECLLPDFREQAHRFDPPTPFPDVLRNAQYRDARFTKIPRALRFNDRVSMRSSTELREPFLDHRLFELALRQPPERKIDQWTGKVLLRKLARRMLPDGLVEAPKRPLQTPQREWLRGPLRDWADDWIHTALSCYGGQWLAGDRVLQQWEAYQQGGSDNSFYVWQWISLGLMSRPPVTSPAPQVQRPSTLARLG